MSYVHPRLYDVDQAVATRRRYAAFANQAYDTHEPYTIFVDPDAKEAVVAFRGTDPRIPEDLDADLDIASGTEANNERFRMAAGLATRAADYYTRKGYSTTFTGHSLGGNLALYAANATGNSSQAYAFNPGMPPAGLNVFLKPAGENVGLLGTVYDFSKELYNKFFGGSGVVNEQHQNQVFRIRGDPISMGTLLNQDPDSYEVHDLDVNSNVGDHPHSISQFL